MSQVAAAQPRARGASFPAYPLKVSANDKMFIGQRALRVALAAGKGSVANAKQCRKRIATHPTKSGDERFATQPGQHFVVALGIQDGLGLPPGR